MILGVLLSSTTLLLVSGVNRQLGLSDELFVLGDSVVLTVLGQVDITWGGAMCVGIWIRSCSCAGTGRCLGHWGPRLCVL